MKMLHKFYFVFGITVGLFPAISQAEAPDASDLARLAGGLLEVKSDSAQINPQKGTVIYSGHVKVSQGARELTGNQLTIYRNAAGEVTKGLITGSPAHYRGRLENEPDIIQAYANEMEYDIQKETVYLRGNARIEREGDVFQAPEIQYDISSEIATSSTTAKGRTRITIDAESTHNLPQ